MSHEHEQSQTSGRPSPKNPLTEEQFSRLAREALQHVQAEQESYPGPPVTENEVRQAAAGPNPWKKRRKGR